MDRGPWQATVHRVAKLVSDQHTHTHTHTQPQKAGLETGHALNAASRRAQVSNLSPKLPLKVCG